MASGEKELTLLEKIKHLASGSLKGATTDRVGTPVDLITEVLRPFGLASEKPVGGSRWLREKVTGSEAEGKDKSIYETIGTFVNPEVAAKAMIVAAVRMGKDVDRAKRLLKDGLSSATVFKETGVYKEGNAYKSVISDAKMATDVLTEQSGVKSLERTINHPELFKAYPELRNIKIVPVEGERAAYYHNGNASVIQVGTKLSPEDQRTAILHEVQHAIQSREKGFSKGSSAVIIQKKNPGISYGDAYKQYLDVPGEVEARFTEGAANETQAALESAVTQLLKAQGTPANPANIVADLERFTAPAAVQEMIVAAAKFPERAKAFYKNVGPVAYETPEANAKLFEKTGVYYDKDYKHKTIISDSKAYVDEDAMRRLRTGTFPAEGTVGDVLVHDELYNLYPGIANIPLKPEIKRGSGGSMATDNSYMTVNPALVQTQEDLLTVLLHESQHAVQHIEGFGKGGATAQFLSFDPVSVQVKLDRARATGDQAQIDAANAYAKKLSAKLDEAKNRYLNLPGEQEARYTQETKGMSEAELAADVKALLLRGDTPQTYDTRPIRPLPSKP